MCKLTNVLIKLAESDNQSMGLFPGEDLLSLSRQLQIACSCGLCEICSVDIGMSTLGIVQEGSAAMLLRAQGTASLLQVGAQPHS